MGMSEAEALNIEIPNNEEANNDVIVREWVENISGNTKRHPYRHKRQIEKVPPLLVRGKKGAINKEYYEPAVVSLGPYHHDKNDVLREAEEYKLIALEEYVSSSRKTIDVFYSKVFEVIHVARKCYVDGSTSDYNDKTFAEMMLRDGCFILFFIQCLSLKNMKVMLNNEYLGALCFANVVRDIFLLENQIPFVVLHVLMKLRFPDDEGEEILNGFFNYVNYGEVVIRREEKVLPSGNERQPLHLLELYRVYFISLACSGLSSGSTTSGKWWRLSRKTGSEDNFNYVKRNRAFSSVMELKAKGIFLKPISKESLEDIKFHSHCYYGQLELVHRVVSPNTQAIFLNMIAYEMCPHNPNDFRVATYVRIMKSLVIHRDDVKELRAKNILVHSLGRDEEVVKMYEEIETPAVNLFMFNQLKEGIERHCNNRYKTWVAELINVYFSSPWKAMALVVAAAILFTSFLQTFYTVNPLPDKTQDEIIKLLTECTHIKRQ